jgi:hypothetical protein
MLNRCSEADDGIPSLFVPSVCTGSPHGSNRNGSAGHCGNDFNHGSIGYLYRLAALPDWLFLAATTWAAVLTVTLTSCLGATSLVLQYARASLAAYCHQSSSRGLIATKQ